jgi:hypothetical protein
MGKISETASREIWCNEEGPGCGFDGNHEYKFVMVRT